MVKRKTKWERDLEKGAKRRGLNVTFQHSAKHLRAHVRNGKKVGTTCISKTPSDGNALKIALGKLSRTFI